MNVDTYPDLFWAVTAVWALIGFYFWRLSVRVSQLEKSGRTCHTARSDSESKS